MQLEALRVPAQAIRSYLVNALLEQDELLEAYEREIDRIVRDLEREH